MPRPIPPPLNVTLKVLRDALGWTQRDLSKATGIPYPVLSDLELGRRPLSRERLDALVATLGLDREMIDLTLFWLRVVQPAPELPESPLNPTVPERRAVGRAAAQVARLAADATCLGLTRSIRAERIRRDREEAERLWPRLLRHSPRARRVLVERAPEFQGWAMCERLCDESSRAAAADAGQALELAGLALLAATRGPGGEAWQSRLQGYAWAFIANARRVASDLPEAERAFATSWRLWEAGEEVDPEPLQEWRLLDLQASLRRAQRRLEEALVWLDRALVKDRYGIGTSRILLNKAFTLEQQGEYQSAIDALREAYPFVEKERDLRLSCVLRFNLAVNLCHLGQHQEAAGFLPELRSMAAQLENHLDFVRALWLEGRISAGLGRRENAISIFEQVRTEFTSRKLPYDVALVTLELAVLYLEEGRVGRVREVAREMAPIFRAQGVHREALAALRIFREAAVRQKATADLAKRLVAYLCLARHDPSLTFTALPPRA